jgi:hypothetical protein
LNRPRTGVVVLWLAATFPFHANAKRDPLKTSESFPCFTRIRSYGFLPGNQSEQALLTLELVGPSLTTVLTANASNGEYEFDFGGPLDISKAIFTAPVAFSALVSDYSVAGFTRQAVPDSGSTMVLLGAALLGLGVIRRLQV